MHTIIIIGDKKDCAVGRYANTTRIAELAVAAASRADRVHVLAGRRTQHLHAMIDAVGNKQPLAARRQVHIVRVVELTSAAAL